MVPRRALRTIGCGLLGVALAVLGITAARWADTRWAGSSGTPPLGPWHQGMTLRETFDGLPSPAQVAPPTSGTTVARARPRLRLLDDNIDAWVERWRVLSETRSSLDITSFVVRNDIHGRALFGLLLEKARQGVAIRLLVDGFGTDLDRSLTDEDYLDELVAAGIETRVYRPLAVRLTQAIADLDPVAAVASEHDKLILADRRRSIMGGRNIGAEYFAALGRSPKAFHDVDVLIDDAAVTAALGRAFAAGWRNDASDVVAGELVDAVSSKDELRAAYRAMDALLHGREDQLGEDDAARADLAELRRDHPELRGRLAAFDDRPDEFKGEVRLLDSSPRGGETTDPITEGLGRLLESAREEVVIETPYLILSRSVVEVFTRAARRGVRIVVVTNSPTSSDNAMSQAFFLEQWPELLARVPTMRLFTRGDGHNLHGKTAVFDDQVAVVSTYNLDPLSMGIQGEVAVIVWSHPFAAQVAAPAREMIAEGPPTTHEYRIRKDPDGRAVRDADGRPIVEFGPQQHSEPGRWKELTAWWTVLRGLKGLGFDPIF